MKKTLFALAVVAFIVAGAAQPAVAQQESPNETQEPETPENETETEDDEEVNETEKENEREAEGRSAQFDARLGVAIDTVSTLVEIAPNEEVRNGLQNALSQLREVQNETDTASLGPEEQPERPEEAEENESGESEEQGKGPPENRGPSGDRGPSQNSNRPGFVNRMLGGIFG
ncbi:hypothetical protein GLU60_00770 [Nanohaloarchaea archaeon H01]|nr:hypothetical protein [Nanohaloarchaea archaeon H01]